MSVSVPQNFYKETVAVAWPTGGGNFYVSTKPTVSVGYLVISASNSSLREIVKFTAVGTDGTGDYVTVDAADRGLGGTSEQIHAVGESVYMNVTAQNIQEISDAIDQIVAAGAQDASTSTKGIVKLSTPPADPANPIAVGFNDTTILPTSDEKAAMAGGGDLGTPSTSNKFMTEQGVKTVESFGTGADGDVVMDGTNTYGGFASKSGNEYTLTRNIETENLTVSSGCTLNTNGYIIKVRNILDGAGTIRHSDPATGVGGNGSPGGGAGSGSGGGGASGAGGGIVLIYAAIWAGTFAIQSVGSNGGNGGNESGGAGAGGGGAAGTQRGAGTLKGPAGQSGAVGVVGTSIGNAGTAGDSVNPCISSNSGATGGAGRRTVSDNINGGAGGAGGTGTLPTFNINAARFLVWMFICIKSDGTLAQPITLPGSGSGGSGGSDSSPNQSAAGGGGGGGNGGHAIMVFKEKTWTGTSSFAAGTGGTGGTGGENWGTHDGANGTTGSLIEFNWSQVG